MPELKKVECSHSSKSDGKITLFAIFVFCRKGTKDFRVYKINKSIDRESHTFPMIKDDDKSIKTEKEGLKILSHYSVNYSFLELIWILFVNISMIGTVDAVFPFRFGQSENKFSILLEMFIRVAISSSVAIIFSFVFLKAYNFLLLQKLREQTKMYSKCETIVSH